MAKAKSIRFVAVGENARFAFCDGDGVEHVVDGKGYSSDDPAVIAFLDAAPNVERAKSSSSSDDEGGS